MNVQHGRYASKMYRSLAVIGALRRRPPDLALCDQVPARVFEHTPELIDIQM